MDITVRATRPSLILHEPESDNALRDTYQAAFAEASELYVVSAYLTEWNEALKLNKSCKRFRLIVGKDFGITRKAACEAALRWLPAHLKGSFLVADCLDGFHPKAIFWKDGSGRIHAVIGSSNLTSAAFAGNYEANMRVQLTQEQFEQVGKWMLGLEEYCVPVSEDWLKTYKEADWKTRSRGKKGASNGQTGAASFNFQLPTRKDARRRLAQRREELRIFETKRQGLLRLFRRCADGEIEPLACYEQLGRYWSHEVGDRLQGRGFAIKGKHADYRQLSRSVLKIVAASDVDCDDVARDEIDFLCQKANPVRGAFLSEMLCLLFPEAFPVLNKPIQTYLKKIQFRAPHGASEGARYIDLARKLRRALRQNPKYPAKNLAELDILIWDKIPKREAKA